ncbi:CBS domain-containing protein [Amycolatopsis mongoliensis]|uniref:CBS domain-containing protein n=1 Tax=Amycolatopsis mongoliensis TaxID=715475 RepID=A0A9Y2JTB6_9PSEU|nr:CBS domain-containing protein [Amycolatopsis sp. 4-36]WIY02967.1 CBS domain-containing protein [Amycolatopsis sp. 4-36]
MREPGPSVGDVVVRLPKTLPVDTSVAQARGCFADDHVQLLLLVESGRLLGTLVRDDLAEAAGGPALAHSHMAGRTIPADVSATDARRLMLSRGQRRLAVVDDDGVLLGLLCLKRRLTGFCGDADVAARAAGRGT